MVQKVTFIIVSLKDRPVRPILEVPLYFMQNVCVYLIIKYAHIIIISLPVCE